MQCQHHIVGPCTGPAGGRVRPGFDNAHIVRRQQALPALCGLPVAVVGIGQRRADDDDAQRPDVCVDRVHDKPQAAAQNTANQPRSSVQARVCAKPAESSNFAKSACRHL